MAEVAVSQTIKIIIGAFVIIALILGFGLYFSDNFLGFFEGISEDSSTFNEVNLSGYKPEPKVVETPEVIVPVVEEKGFAKLNFVPIKLK